MDRAGRTITLTALGADACASTLLLGAGALAHDRLDLPDTLKGQHSARVRPPMVLMSDGGLALASVTGSSLEWHDALCGHTRDEDVDRFGVTTTPRTATRGTCRPAPVCSPSCASRVARSATCTAA